MKIKVFLNIVVILTLLTVVSAQNRYRNQRQSTNRNRSTNRYRNNKNEPIEQGRTLGLLGPILRLGLGGLARPLTSIGLDAPYVPPSTYRPTSTSSDSIQSDPYGGYGGYGGGFYPSQYYGGYNYYPQYSPYRPYRPFYTAPIYGGYRPVSYPSNYGGYPQYNNYYGQRPVYNNQRPASIPQQPVYGQQQQTGLNNLAVPTRPTTTATTTPIAGGGSTNPQINSAQAAQVANLLGQLLGQQLRPLLNQASPVTANDAPDEDDKMYKNRRYH